MAYILVRQTQFLSDKDKQFVISAIEDLDLYKKVLSFAFARNEKQVNDTIVEYMSDAELRTLFFDMGYMALHGLFYGDIDEYNDALVEDLHFDKETVDFLNY